MDVYTIITEKIIASLEKGDVPWRKPWKSSGIEGLPKNALTRKPYHGVNVWMLLLEQEEKGYVSNEWLTYRQAQEVGGNVRKGEKGTMIVFWKFGKYVEEKNGEKQQKSSVVLRYYTVFNVAQCENLPTKFTPQTLPLEMEGIASAEKIVQDYKGPHIRTGSEAYYSPMLDIITMPAMKTFDKKEEYYSTLFHEMIHSTGSEKRLARPGIVKGDGFGNEKYSREELIAEMGAAFLCGMAGIENLTIDNSAAYLKNWMKALKADVRAVVVAASQAQKAAEYVLGTYVKRNETEEGEVSSEDNESLVAA